MPVKKKTTKEKESPSTSSPRPELGTKAGSSKVKKTTKPKASKKKVEPADKPAAAKPMAVKPAATQPAATAPRSDSGSTSAKDGYHQRIRIKIMAYDHKIIDQSTKTIIETAERSGAKIIGPIPLPTKIDRFTVNRSTFVHKDSREQYEMRIHKRLLDIMDPTAKTVDSLTNLNLPAGVDVEIKM